MPFSLGIVGLPNVGKSTLFKSLTKNQVDIANYPFCTISPNVGIVAVPDERLNKLAEFSNSKKIIPTTIEFVDIAGLVSGASKGEGLGNKFLAHIREVDAIVQVVRQFDNHDVVHVQGKIDPENDKQIVNLELILADLETASRHLKKVNDKIKGPHDKNIEQEKIFIERIKKALEDSQLLNQIDFSAEEIKLLKTLNLLTIKPIIYLYNISEQDIGQNLDLPDNGIAICAKTEAELADLSADEAQEYLKELGIVSSGLANLITASYQLLNLITFITTGPEETKAWTVPGGTKAPQAAGVIHTDFEQGFIRAEVINWQKLLEAGSWNAAKEAGQMRMEGKEYVIQDGDTVHFHFN